MWHAAAMRSVALILLVACSRTTPQAAPPPVAIAAAIPPLALAVPGRVALARDAPLYARPADAAAASPSPSTGAAIVSARLIAIHADTVELETTAEPHDCLDDHGLGYRLRVHVPRAALVPRVARSVSDAHVDGTGWLLQVGAPVQGFDHGRWAADIGAVGLVATVPADALALSIAPPSTPAELPPVDVRRASCPAPDEPAPAPDERAADDADNPLSASNYVIVDATPLDLQRATEARCQLRADAGPLTIGDRPAIDAAALARADHEVLVGDGGYLVWTGDRCGELRARTTADAVEPLGPGGATAADPTTAAWRVARAGAQVTWPDGSPAGTADGTYAFPASEVAARGDRLCITRPPIATPICHRATDVVPAPR